MDTINLLSPGQNPNGFKEWAGVCELLAAGRTSLILRRGGISEGRGGFHFAHEEFFLFPTLFHEQDQKLAWTAPRTAISAGAVEPGSQGTVRLHLYARIEHARVVEDLAELESLSVLHPWSADTVRERFHWRGGADIKLAVVRVYRLREPWEIASSPEFGGCRSWVELPPLDAPKVLEPVLSDQEHQARLKQLI